MSDIAADRAWITVTAPVMDRTIFLKNYRIRVGYDGSPYEPERNEVTARYEAVDQRTAEPVSITLIPADRIDLADRAQFEEELSTAQKLRHVNVAKLLDFGREDDDYVYVSERLPGESLASWVKNHGPMAADAALRTAEQIVSVLSSAGFHKLPYPSIQPGDVVLVPGQTAEGTWPLVKVTNFGLPAFLPVRPLPGESEVHQEPATAEQISSNQQFSQPTRDISSEIYSLGVTLYYLLTGIALSAEALKNPPKFSGFPKPLRVLLGRMLHRNPDQRPKDLLIVTEMLRQALDKIERRRALSDRYGIPFRTAVTHRKKAGRHRLTRSAVATAVLLLLAMVIAPIVFPESVGKMLRSVRNSKPAGVLIGVPDSLAAPVSRPAAAQAAAYAATTAPPANQPHSMNPTVAAENQPAADAAPSVNPPGIRPGDIQQAQIANAQGQVAASTDSAQNVAAPPEASTSADAAANSSAQTNPEPEPASSPISQAKKKSMPSASKRGRAVRNSDDIVRHSRAGSMRSRVVGITSDGRLILRLSSGRTAIVAPDEDRPAPRHRSRVLMDPDQAFGPPDLEPDYGPDD